MLPGEGIAGVLEEPTAAKTQTVDPVFECKAVDAVQTPLAGPTDRALFFTACQRLSIRCLYARIAKK